MSTALAPLLASALPLWPWPKPADLGGLRPADTPEGSKFLRAILSQPFAPLQSSIVSAPPQARSPQPTTASHAVSSPSTSSRRMAATHPGGNQPPSTCPHSVSHALRALLRHTPAGLVSCRSRPWGCTLQGRNPPAEPHLLSEAVALVRLANRSATVPSTVALRASGRSSNQPWRQMTALRPTSPTTGRCSPRASVPRSRLFTPTQKPRPSWASSSLGDSLSELAALPGPILS
jgi:hypothetical protein